MLQGSDQSWTGESFADLRVFLYLYTSTNYPAGPIPACTCNCGGQAFSLQFDDEAGAAQRHCLACGSDVLLADSWDRWDDADPCAAECSCGSETFELGVAFSLREDGDIRLVTVGGRCLVCGMLGVYVDWNVDYSPTDHLLTST